MPDAPRTRRRPSPGRAVKLLAGFVAASVGAGALAAGIAAPAVLAAGSTSNDVVGAFNALPTALDQPPLSEQSRILYSDGSPMATFYYENRISVPLAQVAPVMQQAIVAIEDNRFYEHGGVDPRGLSRALVQNAQGDDVQGASTLTQQWIKNVQVEEALADLPTDATAEQRQAAFQKVTVRSGLDGYARKLREMKLAIAVEKKYSKDQILENYLNIANFAGGQYGVEAASRHWFNRSAADLPLEDAALLAGIVQNPTGYDPQAAPEAAQARRDVVLDRMLQLGVIDPAAHDAAVAVPIAAQLSIQPTPNGCEQAGQAGFFCDYVIKQYVSDDVFGGTKEERTRELYRGGLSITTTLDRNRQQAAFDEINARVPADGSSVPTSVFDPKSGRFRRVDGTSNVGGSIVSVEPGTGRIVAMAENRVYSTSPDAPVGATSINYNTDKAMGGSSGFQPGSNFKPFVLATWLASGRTLNATVNGTKRDYPNSSWKYGSCLPPGAGGYVGDPYGPANAGDGEESSTMSVLQATYDSVNTGYAAIENQLPLCDVRSTAEALGVHKAKATKTQPGGEVSTEIDAQPSMMLGSNEVAPLTIATAYAAFAAQGTWCAPMAIASITDADGSAVAVPGPQCKPAISADVANGVTYALQRTITQGTAAGNDLAGGRVAAGKTGTTNNDVATWFTGYTPQLSTSVWIGTPERSMTLDGATIAGTTHRKMYGATVSAPVWKAYMDRALDGTEQAGFTDPPRSVLGSYTAPRSSSSSSSPSPRASRTRRSAPAPTSQAPAPAPTTDPGDDGDDGDDAADGGDDQSAGDDASTAPDDLVTKPGPGDDDDDDDGGDKATDDDQKHHGGDDSDDDDEDDEDDD